MEKSKIAKFIIDKTVKEEIDIETSSKLLTMIKEIKEDEENDIAIIGMAVNMPKAENIDEFWNNICHKISCIDDFPENRINDTEKLIENTFLRERQIEYLKAGYLKEVDKFDNEFFNVSPYEAKLIDPHQRLLLQCMWEAIEDAGYGNKIHGSKAGIYLGHINSMIGNYCQFATGEDIAQNTTAFIGNLNSIMSRRLSYLFNLRGPNVTIDTACSSSLVAVHLACKGIKNHDCDVAICGAVNLALLPISQYVTNIGIESVDSNTRTFDNASTGTCFSEGVATIILKSLKNAIKDRDNIYAVIKGSAINQDGTSSGITAPSSIAQEEVIIKALEDAKVPAESIGYIEAHGTGTRLGDPIEVEGITRAFRKYTDKKQICAISSIKSNLGHLNSVAGIGGLIKMALSIYNKKLPPSINFNKPNKFINFINSPVYVNTSLKDWNNDKYPIRGGVSSFGFSGTNCHVILEEAPEVEKVVQQKNEYNILTLSAKTSVSLKGLINKYHSFIMRNKEINLEDLCYSANVGRDHYQYRIVFLIKDLNQLFDCLSRVKDRNLEHISDSDIFYGNYKVVNLEKANLMPFETTKETINNISVRANNLISNKHFDKKELSQLCELYVEGAEINWNQYYSNEKYNIISIPTYHFNQKRFWLDLANSTSNQSKTNKKLYYKTEWRQLEDIEYTKELKKNIILFTDSSHLSHQLIESLRKQNKEVIEVEVGNSFIQLNPNKFLLGNLDEDYMKLFKYIGFNNVEEIVYLSSTENNELINSREYLDEVHEKGVFSLINLVKALEQRNIKNNINIHLVCKNVYEITKKETYLNPLGSCLYGFGKVINNELRNIECYALDIDEDCTADDVIRSISYKGRFFMTALRNRKLYSEVFEEMNVDSFDTRQISIKQGGTYVITGGTGGLGLEMSKFLVNKNNVNLVLINRTELPKKETWRELIHSIEDEKLKHKLKMLIYIEEKGSNVVCINANISNSEEMEMILEDVRNKFGSINGIIHCAGVGNIGLVKEKTEDEVKNTFDPKVNGSIALDLATRRDNLDFFMIYSSAATVWPGISDSDYVAANCFLDAFTDYRNRYAKNTITFNWTIWKETGMSACHVEDKEIGVFKALPTKVAMNCVEEILCKDISRVIVGEFNSENDMMIQLDKYNLKFGELVNKDLNVWKKKIEDRLLKEQENAKKVSVKGRPDGNYSELELKFGQICGEILEFDEIDIYDNLLELGADSITAIKIVNKINRETGHQVKLIDLLTQRTIAAFVEVYQKNYAKDEEYKELDVVEEKEYYPASSQQKRMYMLQKMDKESVAYNTPGALEIVGDIDLIRLHEVFMNLIKRHETLRTSFHAKGNEIMQKIHSIEEIEFNIEKIKLQSDEDQKEKIRQFIKPFNLEKAPLLRVLIMSLDKDRHILVFDMHHIISDGTSMTILTKEFNMLYAGKSLSDLKIQYKDYSVWQLEKKESEWLRKQEEYWLKEFNGEIPLLKLPTDYERPDIKEFNGSSINFVLDKEMTRNLRKVAKETGSTMYMVLLASINILLSKYSRQEDIVVGSPIVGRNHSDLENLIGMFVNTLAIRTNVDNNLSFKNYLELVKEKSIKAYENQYYQFDELVEKLDISRNPNRNPLFDVMFVLQNMEQVDIEVEGVSFNAIDINENVEKFDITIVALEGNHEVKFKVSYATSLYKFETINNMFECFKYIIKLICSNPEVIIKNINLTTLNEVDDFLSNINYENLYEDESDFKF